MEDGVGVRRIKGGSQANLPDICRSEEETLSQTMWKVRTDAQVCALDLHTRATACRQLHSHMNGFAHLHKHTHTHNTPKNIEWEF